jgi:hypothetical protein
MRSSNRRGLQATLAVIGGVATLAGANGVLRGAAEVFGGGPVSARVDSEYRFYASWYPVFGVLLLRAARQPENERLIVRAGAAGFLLAAGGRLLSIRKLGPPNALQKTLLGLEVVLPVVIVPWQERVSREARLSVLAASPPG